MGAGTTLLASAGCTIDGGVAAADADEERDRNTDDQGVPNPRSVPRRDSDGLGDYGHRGGFTTGASQEATHAISRAERTNRHRRRPAGPRAHHPWSDAHADAHAVSDADADPNSHPDAHPHRIGHADAISPSDAHPVTA